MKVIDLLNKIANGEEVPEKIIYEGTSYSYEKGVDYKNKYGGFLMGGRVFISYEDLNDEIEIIEEPQEHKISEKFEIYYNSIEWCCNDRSITDNEKDIMDKINEIIDYLEEIKNE